MKRKLMSFQMSVIIPKSTMASKGLLIAIGIIVGIIIAGVCTCCYYINNKYVIKVEEIHNDIEQPQTPPPPYQLTQGPSAPAF